MAPGLHHLVYLNLRCYINDYIWLHAKENTSCDLRILICSWNNSIHIVSPRYTRLPFHDFSDLIRINKWYSNESVFARRDNNRELQTISWLAFRNFDAALDRFVRLTPLGRIYCKNWHTNFWFIFFFFSPIVIDVLNSNRYNDSSQVTARAIRQRDYVAHIRKHTLANSIDTTCRRLLGNASTG